MKTTYELIHEEVERRRDCRLEEPVTCEPEAKPVVRAWLVQQAAVLVGMIEQLGREEEPEKGNE